MNAVTTDCAPMVRTAPAWLTPLELTALGAIWGASFLFMRVAAPDFGAAPLVAVRTDLAPPHRVEHLRGVL